VALAIAACAWIGTDAAAAEPELLLARLEGRWQFAGDPAEVQARLDAIEATVSRMMWIARGTARKRITKATVIHEQYVFTVAPDAITIAEDEFAGFTTPWDGTEVQIPKDRGGPAVLTRRFEEDGLTAHWQQKRGAGTEIYRVSPDGATMTVTVVISSPRLPSDVRYALTYRRATGAPGPAGPKP
jgi:hypothetical protein